jgi:nitrogen fixation-related uncharacterized protein
MHTPALLMMISANVLITGVTLYFFWKVLRSGSPDSVDEDDANFPRGG